MASFLNTRTIFLNIESRRASVSSLPQHFQMPLLIPTHSACSWQTGRFARLRPQGFRPLPVIPPAPWNCPASLGSPEPRGEGRARGQQLPDRWSRSPGRLSLGPFSLRVKPRHRISRLAGWLRYENRSFLSLSFRFQLKRSDRHPTLSLLCSLSLCRPPLVCHGTGHKSRHQSRAAALKSELHPFSAPQPTVWELQTITRVACPYRR